MKSKSTLTVLAAAGTVVICLLGVGFPRAQAQAGQTPQLAKDVFLNVPALGERPVDEFMDTMGMIAASLSVTCSDCHVTLTGGWEEYAEEEIPLKRTARGMILMVERLNRDNFGGRPVVTCYSCHRGNRRPHVIPDLGIQYDAPPQDPHEIFFPTRAVPGMATADEVFDNYIEALGGAGPVANLTSLIANGTYSGFDTEFQAVPVEIFGTAPDQRATTVHTPYGNSVRTYDGREGWIAAPDRALPLLPLTGGNLEGARTEAILLFPAGIQQAFSQWRVGFSTFIDDREVHPVQGISPGEGPVNFYFDVETGLLVRVVRYTETQIGTVPTQLDFADYREVSGVLIPFSRIVTWTNGQATIELTEVQPNVAIDAARFQRPAPSPPPIFQ